MMRNTIHKLLPLLLIAFIATSCYKNEVKLYSGPSQAHFMRQDQMVIVDSEEAITEVQIGLTRVVDYDQTFSVVIEEDKSTAVEGVHFEFVSNTVVVPAGEVFAYIPVKGLYPEAVEEGVTLGISLSAEKEENIAKFENEFSINFFKFCDYDRRMFTGDFHVVEKASNGVYEYDITMEAGESTYAVLSTGLWDVHENYVQIMFDRNSTDSYIPDAFFFEDLDWGYENAWIKSLTPGIYNSCLGAIYEIEYFIYPKDDPLNGYDKGTFTIEKLD